MNFAAIEVHKSEAPHAAVEVFMQEADHRGFKFKHLEVLRVFDYGTRRFAHIKTDCRGLLRILKTLQPTRAMIIPTPEGRYRAYLPGGREGDIPISTMTTVNGRSYRTYRGPGVKHWERQFLPMGAPE